MELFSAYFLGQIRKNEGNRVRYDLCSPGAMIMTAILTFFGLSTCATLFIVATVALKARVTLTDGEVCEAETAREARGSASVMPAFSH
jgi:hypothetical protein